MCCKSTADTCHGVTCSCGNGAGSLFWSEKKRIRMVKTSIDCLESQVKDLKEYLKELEGKP